MKTLIATAVLMLLYAKDRAKLDRGKLSSAAFITGFGLIAVALIPGVTSWIEPWKGWLEYGVIPILFLMELYQMIRLWKRGRAHAAGCREGWEDT